MNTILDVAKLAQVSVGTVSHVVNDSTYVSPKLRDRVLKAIRALNYHPNAMARGLRTRLSHSVGMIIPNISDPFFPSVVRGAEDVLVHSGYQLILGNSDDDVKKEEAYYDTFRSERVDGLLLIVSPSDQAPDYLKRHHSEIAPIVLLDRFYRGLPYDVVALNDEEGSYQAVSHLLSSGHRKIATITGPLRLLNARMRLDGYKRAFADHGVPVPKPLIYEGRFDSDSGYEAISAFQRDSLRPTAIFAANQQMATGVLRAFRDFSIRCPEECALVSFGDMDWFELVQPRISAVRLPSYDLGATGADILVKRMSGKLTGAPQHKYLMNKLLVRGSSVGNHVR